MLYQYMYDIKKMQIGDSHDVYNGFQVTYIEVYIVEIYICCLGLVLGQLITNNNSIIFSFPPPTDHEQ